MFLYRGRICVRRMGGPCGAGCERDRSYEFVTYRQSQSLPLPRIFLRRRNGLVLPADAVLRSRSRPLLTSYLRIPGITKGSHSWQQVFKSGFTKTWRYGFRMSLKTLAKGAGYLGISSFSTGFVVGNLMQSFSNWLLGQFFSQN